MQAAQRYCHPHQIALWLAKPSTSSHQKSAMFSPVIGAKRGLRSNGTANRLKRPERMVTKITFIPYLMTRRACL
ncbi:hypothetical protein ALP59_200096 [Pseudomonas savastanoi]|uniref:Uncharacterized protein n=1 Tax=Pseudomonas savastanoi TaxID=29438 RepID=A0A3M5GH57_PSESS|nr:hypothetical protein ALP59_200096 [Pseudomonas savastanoi]